MKTPLIIDAHIHLYQTRERGLQAKEGYEIWEYGAKADVRFSSYSGDLGSALKAIDEAGASRAVVVNLCSPSEFLPQAIAELPGSLDKAQREDAVREIHGSMGERLKASNIWVCDAAREHSQLVPFIGVDPSILSVEETEAHVREMVDIHRARGIKVHPVVQRFYMHDERMLPIWKTCVELGLPVIAHSGPSQSEDQYAEPMAFTEVLRAFPRLRLVLSHMGGGAWRQLTEVAMAHPNAYFDVCEIIEWTGAPNAPSDRQLAQLILDVGPERVMMGSDFPWYDIDQTVKRVMDLPLLSSDQKEAILGVNAVRILNI